MKSAACQLRAKSWTKGAYLISTDPSLIPIPKVVDVFASNDFYWANTMPEQAMKETIENSLTFGLYLADQAALRDDARTGDTDSLQLLGIARGITDFTTFFFLTDVWVDPLCQGQGLGSWLIGCVQEVIESMPHLRRSMLMTANWERTVPFYEKLMEMKLLECQKGQGLAIMERKGMGHPSFGQEGSGYN